jgi:parallel beta-helix repeat protein
MIRKWLAIGIILLFIGTYIIPKATSQPLSRNILTVDDEPGDAQYMTISEALRYASPGDTIRVYSGSYLEWNINITVNNLTIEGVAKELGSGNDTGLPFVYTNSENDFTGVFFLEASHVVLWNFTVQTNAKYGSRGITISSDHCIVTCCDFPGLDDNGMDYGVILSSRSGFSIVSNNTFSNCSYSIFLGCNNTLVADNFIEDSPRAITVEGGLNMYGVYNNTILRNTVVAPSDYGLALRETRNITVSYNNFHGGRDGIYLEYDNDNVVITRNNISGMFGAGIAIEGEFLESIHHTIQENNIISSSVNLSCSVLTGHINLEKNYWTDYLGVGPKIIWGYKIIFNLFVIFGMIPILIPWAYVDWHPAQEPYDIPGMR